MAKFNFYGASYRAELWTLCLFTQYIRLITGAKVQAGRRLARLVVVLV